jgi:hypothetical protein
MILIPRIFLYSTYYPTNALNTIQYNTKRKIQFMTNYQIRKCFGIGVSSSGSLLQSTTVYYSLLQSTTVYYSLLQSTTGQDPVGSHTSTQLYVYMIRTKYKLLRGMLVSQHCGFMLVNCMYYTILIL